MVGRRARLTRAFDRQAQRGDGVSWTSERSDNGSGRQVSPGNVVEGGPFEADESEGQEAR